MNSSLEMTEEQKLAVMDTTRDHWVPNKSAKQCNKCLKEFNFFRRRHHCRICGNVFCSNCCNTKKNHKIFNGKKNKKTLKKARRSKGSTSIRICEKCLEQYTQLQEMVEEKMRRKNDKVSSTQIFNQRMFSSFRESMNNFRDEADSFKNSSSQSVSSRDLDFSITPTNQNSSKIDSERFNKNGNEEERRSNSLSNLASDVEVEKRLSDTSQITKPREDRILKLISHESNKDTGEESIADPGLSKVRSEIVVSKSIRKEIEEYLYNTHIDEYNRNQEINDWNPKKRELFNDLDRLIDYHVHEIVDHIFQEEELQEIFKNQNKNNEEIWKKRFLEYIIKAIRLVKPSERLMKDTMNINDYVMINLIDHENDKKCSYINGCVIKNNIADRRMRSEIKNPKILLIGNSVGFTQEDTCADIETLVKQEEHYTDILMERISQVKPDVIILEKDISRAILVKIKNLKITVITNVERSSIEKIARSTETLIIPSVNLIQKKTVLGSCKKFYVKKGSTKVMKEKSKIMTMNQNLIYFDGCKPWYGSTICLSGPDPSALEIISKYLKQALKYCRDLVLEREYLFVSDADSEDKMNTPFLLPKVGIGKFSLKYVSAVIKRKKNSQNPDGDEEENDDSDENEESNCEERIGMGEAQVRKKMEKMCGKPNKNYVEFYDNEDITLGAFLRKMCNEANENCRFCKKKNLNHVTNFYHGEGVIEISISEANKTHTQLTFAEKEMEKRKSDKNSSKKEKIVDSSSPITMSQEMLCKENQNKDRNSNEEVKRHCDKKIIGQKKSLVELQEYSFAKFLQQYFYNPNLLLQYTDEEVEDENLYESSSSNSSSPLDSIQSERKIHRDLIRTFALGDYRIKVKYKKIDTYTIDIVKFREIDNSSYLDSLSHKELELIRENFSVCASDISNEFQKIKFGLEKILDIPNSGADIFSVKNRLRANIRESSFRSSRILQNELNFRSYFEDTQDLLLNAENDFDKFKEDSFLEIDKFVNLEERNVLHLSMLRKKILIQIFNYTCIIFKSKRLLKRITETLYKLEPWQKQKKVKKESHNRNENSTSLIKDREPSDVDNRIPMTPSGRTRTTYDIKPLSDFSMAVRPDSPEKDKKVSNLKSLKELAGRHKARTSSIDVIIEENEHMLDEETVSNQDRDKSLDVKSEYNEIFPSIKIDLEDVKKLVKVQPKTDKIEVRNFSPPSDEEAKAEIFGELLASLEGEESTFLDNGNFKELQSVLLSLKTGINNISIPIHRYDVGSIIAYSLSTNCYYEGLARQNYMEFQSKFDHSSGEEMDINSKLHTASKMSSSPTKGPKDYVEKRDGVSSRKDVRPNSNNKRDTKKKEMIVLNDKTDVLDSEHQPHHIESEFLSYEKINFKMKWSTVNKEIKMKIDKNNTKLDSIESDVQEYCHKDKNIDELILPSYSKNFLDDENIVNNYLQLNEIKRSLELNSTQSGPKTKRNKNDVNLDSISNNNYHIPAPTLQLTKAYSAKGNTTRQTMDKSISKNSSMIPDLVITPMQTPVNQLTEKYKSKKVADILKDDHLDFEVTIYFPKKFEALRKFYCGSHEDFIKSIMKTSHWHDNSGGKTNSPFFKSGDQKYIFKEVNRGDIRMFTDFTPRYFDYLCKSFFHNFPCALAKILGAYKVTIKTNGRKNSLTEKYYVIIENINYGITDETHIIRYDLKGSTRNRFIRVEEPLGPRIGAAPVCLDTNFLLDNKSRPMALKNVYYKILMICINNDSLFFSRSNIVDYSLLVVIDKKNKTVRFGIIDYIQQYTMEKMVESKFKALIAAGDLPTILDPAPYKTRFQEAMKKYFIGV
ncbi:unnamed protein product [Moneuplotes crassus]|uniref:1-phosphatidylinositol-3-phosphate 5-kinase n=2 Tax=Euplotes crassus TaxID=5936 RepID=A0AAD1Y1M3_EUPCR|nr:unnamed protein product [Moneuplotes crassus]